jgi:hypothetical protein
LTETKLQCRLVKWNIEHYEKYMGRELILEQFNNFSKVKTPDDGQLGPKHVSEEEK